MTATHRQDELLAGSSYNYYPRTMIRLCEISYDDMDHIRVAVRPLGLEVVWGPAELDSSWGVSYSRMFIVHRKDPDEYTVVIRGTNFDSWESWTKQDFAVGTTVPFNQLAPQAPANALIAQGTFNGMNDLLQLRDPTTGTSAVDFLKKADPTYLYVTGHSLGGTLTPTMFMYLNDILYGGGYVHNMASWSFAGLTAGDAGFNSYYNSLSNPQFPWRLHNTLDIAPLCWYSLDEIKSIYAPNDLHYGFPESDLLDDLFKKAAGKGYAQPLGDKPLPGTFYDHFPDDDVWVLQALHNHHSTTYQGLVDAAYPAP